MTCAAILVISVFSGSAVWIGHHHRNAEHVRPIELNCESNVTRWMSREVQPNRLCTRSSEETLRFATTHRIDRDRERPKSWVRAVPSDVRFANIAAIQPPELPAAYAIAVLAIIAFIAVTWNSRRRANQFAMDRSRSEQLSRRFHAVEEATDGAIIETNLSGIVKGWSKGAEQLYGFEESEVLHQSLSAIATEPKRDEFNAILQRIARGHRLEQFETSHRRKGGAEIEIELTVAPIRDAKMDVVGACAVARNITDFKRAASELTSHAEELRRSTQALQHIINIARSARPAPPGTPESLSQSISRILGASINDDAKMDIDALLDRSEGLIDVIDGVIELSRSNPRRRERTLIDTDALARDVIRTLRPPAQIKVHIKRSLPNLCYNAAQLRQVFEDLISNAILHLGKPVGEVEISCRQFNRMHQFRIKDNGVGIAEDQFDRIMGRPPSNGGRESGIGLFIVARIIERNGGRMQLFSKRGDGTEVLFTIPITDAQVKSPAIVLADSG